jgi:hypothetical protein
LRGPGRWRTIDPEPRPDAPRQARRDEAGKIPARTRGRRLRLPTTDRPKAADDHRRTHSGEADNSLLREDEDSSHNRRPDADGGRDSPRLIAFFTDATVVLAATSSGPDPLVANMGLQQSLQTVLTTPAYLIAWGVLVSVSLAILAWDLRKHNSELGSLMQFVWGFTVLYSGPVGLVGYLYAGRTQISHDSLWRKGFRSVSQCYSGCGTGEVLGVSMAVGLFAFKTTGTVLLTFALAYFFGYLLTVGPLMQEGVSLREALKDAFYSETASITVMEIVAISVDVWLAGDAGLGDVLFWTSLVFSLTLGLLAAYPVNLLLIHVGVKEGMMNPAEMGTEMGT